MNRASVILLAALAVGGCRNKTKAAVTTSPETRQAPGAEIAAAPVAAVAASPLVGPEGNDASGFPLRHVDRVVLRGMLSRRQFAELSSFFEEVETAFEADPTREYWPMDAADAFASAEPAIVPALDAWVAATPESFAPIGESISVRPPVRAAKAG